MRLVVVIILTAFLQVSASSFGQGVTLTEKNATLQSVFDKISTQTGKHVFFSDDVLLNAKKVTVKITNLPLNDAMDVILKDQPLAYQIKENTIVILKKEHSFLDKMIDAFARIDVKGRVIGESNERIVGATVSVKGMSRSVRTNDKGEFFLNDIDEKAVLVISSIGFTTREVAVKANLGDIQLRQKIGELEQLQVIGYGTTTKRLNTGSVSTISSAEIAKQPVTNVLSALSGRMPGVFVQTTNGLPGGGTSISIRGKGSITAGTNPLYIIDGVPFSSAIGGSSFTSAVGTLSTSSVNGAVSPLNSINPDDIESISVLKDADATSIYGSRGSNGVVLITTKKGKLGKTSVDINFSQGYNKAAALPKLLNLQQYLTIRKEAFANDGLVPSSDPTSDNYAPDLTVWSDSKSTDWAKYLIGNTGHYTDVQATIQGGSGNTSFNLGANFHSETPYLLGSNLYQRGGMRSNLQHHSLDNKFFLQLSNSLILDDNKLSNANISASILLPPNYPLYDAAGNYNWFYLNPAAKLNQRSYANTFNTINNLILSYSIIPDLKVKISGGYSRISLKQTQIFPPSGLRPGDTNYAYFGNNTTETYIAEPQIDYNHHFKGSSLQVLLGGTYQNTVNEGDFIDAEGFSSESLMKNYGSAATITPLNSFTQYKYASAFARATYNLLDRYIFNATARRDGSSRFGPGNQFGNFGSLGAAWLFGEEKLIKSGLAFLSHGKLRASYGLTGNDQITDYQFLSTYGSSGNIYQGISGLKPSRIANSNFHWETTHKLDLALELGFFSNWILLNMDYYRNQSSDQLVNYKIPYLTGFATYQANLPAKVVNSGWEFELNSKNIQGQNFRWETSFNLTIPKNELKSFENFSTSSYAQTLQLGYDVTRVYGYQFIGLNQATGLAEYASKTGEASSSPYFFNTIGKQTPDFYGGLSNGFTFMNWQLDVFAQFTKTMAVGGIAYTPGILSNNYVVVLDRWRSGGDQTTIPKSSTVVDYNYSSSSANYFDASYIRLKNVALSYNFSRDLLKKIRISNLKVYMQGQNLLTAWHKNAALLDPESGALPNLPPAKSVVAGFQLTL